MDFLNRRFASVTFVGLGLLGFLLFSQKARAEVSASQADTQVSTSTTTVQSSAKSAKKRLNMVGFWVTSSGLQQTSDPNYSAESDFTLFPTYDIGDSFQLVGEFGFKQELTQKRRLLGADGYAGLQYGPIKLNSALSFSPALAMGIPFSDVSRNQDSMYTSVIGMGTLSFNGAAIGLKPLSITYLGSLTRSFYQYYTATTGDMNIQYSLSHAAWITYSFSDKFSYLETLEYTTGWDYQGNPQSNFMFSEEFDYQMLKPVLVGLGLSNGGNVLAANQQTSNLAIYNPDSASVYASVVLRY